MDRVLKMHRSGSRRTQEQNSRSCTPSKMRTGSGLPTKKRIERSVSWRRRGGVGVPLRFTVGHFCDAALEVDSVTQLKLRGGWLVEMA